MKRLILTITGVLILISSVFCQVDTLMLLEINDFEIVDDITNLFIEDLNGDSIKELIICTYHFIYIYNSSNNDLLWTSPPLLNPEDLLFEDINHDGLLDLSVKDSLNIYLFDPHNYNTIWTSPALDSTYKCYTLGDRNDDGWMDVAIVSKEPFVRIYDPYNLDTVWVYLYDGPYFEQQSNFTILMPNYTFDGINGIYTDTPNNVVINKISDEIGLQTKIIIFSYVSEHEHIHGTTFYYLYSGNTWIIDPLNFYNICIDNTGRLLFYNFLMFNESIYLFTLCHWSYQDLILWPEQWSFKKYLNYLSADSLINSQILWQIENVEYENNWEGYVIGEISNISQIDEICFGAQDSLYLYSFPELDNIWITTGIINLKSVQFIISASLFDNPQVICSIADTSGLIYEYQFFSGADGSLTSILPSPGFEISDVSDLDNDNNDELLSIQDNSLHIYHLEQYVDINNPKILPHTTFIQPNYPNPFNTSTIIEYGLSMDAFVTINIYDLLGRKVETIVSENKPAGFHQVIWNATDKPSGIYFYKIQEGEYTKTKKMLLLK